MPMPMPIMNPTGVYGSGNFNGGFTTSSGTGGPGNYGFGNMNPAPIARSSVNPMSSQNPGGGSQWGTVTSEGSTTASQNPYGQSQSQQNWTEKYLQETYGGGMGSLIYQYLMSNGGYNSALTQQSVDSQINAMQQQTQLGQNNLISSLGAMGVSAGSSGLPEAVQQYQNQALQQQNAITAQEYYNMWQQSQQNELNMMEFAAEGVGKMKANKSNWMDYLGAGLGVAQTVAGFV